MNSALILAMAAGEACTNSGMFAARSGDVIRDKTTGGLPLALLVDVREAKLRVIGTALRGKDEPLAVGRPAMP